MTADRADHIRRLIAARCPELSEADIAEAFSEAPAQDIAQEDIIPACFAEALAEVLDAIDAQLGRIEQR